MIKKNKSKNLKCKHLRSYLLKLVNCYLQMREKPLRTEFPVFWEFLGILKNSQQCK